MGERECGGMRKLDLRPFRAVGREFDGLDWLGMAGITNWGQWECRNSKKRRGVTRTDKEHDLDRAGRLRVAGH